MIIGVDFDNTIAGYDELFSELAAKAGIIKHGVVETKQIIRNLVRASPEGETAWHRMQAIAYGERMREATLINGVADFFCAANLQNIPLHIISHKTIWAADGLNKVNLQDAAYAWMTSQHFFSDEAFGLSWSSVFFELSKEAKIARVALLGCTHFIDDLVETFAEPGFPDNVEKILFSSDAPDDSLKGVRHYYNWSDIQMKLLGGAL